MYTHDLLAFRAGIVATFSDQAIQPLCLERIDPVVEGLFRDLFARAVREQARHRRQIRDQRGTICRLLFEGQDGTDDLMPPPRQFQIGLKSGIVLIGLFRDQEGFTGLSVRFLMQDDAAFQIP